MTKQLDQYLLDQAVRLAQPLKAASASPDAALRLATALGWDLGAIAGVPSDQLASAVSATASAFSNVQQTIEQGPADLTTLAEALLSCATAFADLRQVVTGWTTTDASLPSNLLETFADDLVGYLLDVYLSGQVPRLRAILQVAGVYQPAVTAAITRSDGTVVRHAQPRPSWNLDLLMKALTDPPGLARQLYTNVGGSPQAPSAIADLVGPLLAEALAELGIPAHYGTPGATTDSNLSTGEQDAAQHLLHVRVTVRADPQDVTTTAILDLTLGLTEISGALAVIVAALGQLAATRTIGNWNLSASLTGQLQPFLVSAGAVTFVGTTAADQLQLTTSATRAPTSDGPMLRLGKPPGSRLEIGGLALSLQLTVSPSGASFSAEVALEQAQLVVAAGDGDGFLRAVLPASPVQLPIPLALDWSPSKGFVVRGANGLRIDLAPHHPWGPVNISSLLLELRQDTAGPALETSVSGNLTLGPLTVSVDRVGVLMTVLTNASGGSFGPLDVKAGFKLPNGAGLKIDAGAVTGGGFVLCDAAKQRYAGLLQLRILDQVSATVIALLDAAGPGWSLLGLVFVDGFEPIELGFGFTLNKVGGMVGLNRSAAVDALRAGLRSGGLDSVMFPANPVAQAPRLIGQLEQEFPAAPGRYLFGPMAEIGWGDPTVLRIKLGLLIELPAPVRLILLAQVSALLPDEHTKLIELHVDAVGVIDFSQRTAALDAVLHHSRVAAFSLSGELALRAAWGQQRELVLAVGGLHPRFQPPAGFPVLPRVVIAMASGDNPRLHLEAYLAVTSNTVQIGAKLQLHATAGDFALDGLLGFDALFHLSPFSFEAEMAGGLALTYKGSNVMTVAIDLMLSGPAPWHAKGTASFSVLFATVTISFDVSWGQPADLTSPVTAPDPKARLLTELGTASSWSAQAPAGLNSMVGLGLATRSGPVAHPLGRLVVHQRAVPLGLELQRFGGAELAQPVTLGIDAGSVTVDGLPATGLTPVQDYFAPAQYRDLTDDQKLSSPSYESYESGLSFGLAGFQMAGWQSTPVGYVTLIADPAAPAVTAAPATAAASTAAASSASASPSPSVYQPPGATVATQLATGAAAQAPAPGQSRYLGVARPLGTTATTYLVLGTEDLLPHTDGGLPQQPVSYTEARDALAAYLAAHPQAQGQLQVASARQAVTGDQPPRSRLAVGSPQYQAQTAQPWISPATTLEISGLAGTAVASISYRWYQQGTTPPTWTMVTGRQVSFGLTGPDGFYQLDWHAADAAGNAEAVQSQVLRLDGTAPASELAGSPPLDAIAGDLYATGATELTLTATDAGSGVAGLSYRCYPQGTTPPAFTTVTAAQASFALPVQDGTYQADWYATDQVGNQQAQQTQQVTLDTQPPVSTLVVGNPQFPPGAPQFVTGQTKLAVTATDAGSGVASVGYRWYPAGGEAPAFTVVNAASARFALNGADGSYQLDWYSTDNLGNTEAASHQVLQLDDTPPASSLAIGGPDYPATAPQFVTSASALALTAQDAGSGVGSISYRYYPAGQPATPWTVAAGAQVPFTVQGADGPYQIDWYATDQVGNQQAQQTRGVALDNTAPVTTLAVGDPQYPAAAPQYVTSASLFALTAADAGSGVSAVSYRWYAQGAPAPPMTQDAAAQVSFTLHGPDGTYQADWQSVDNLGNLEAIGSEQVQLDNTPPVITITQPTAVIYVHSATLNLSYSVTDGAGSGVASVTPTLDNQASLAGHGLADTQPIVLLTELALGSHVFAITACDNLGNTTSTSVTFTIIVTADSIKQDVSYFQSINEIADPTVATALLSQLTSAATARAKGQCATAAQIYQTFINLLSNQSGKSVSPRAAAIMTADAQYLINHCP